MAEACGVSTANVYQWSRGIRPVPVEHCAAIEAATQGAITRRDLRPNDWAYIWPELAINESSQPHAQLHLESNSTPTD